MGENETNSGQTIEKGTSNPNRSRDLEFESTHETDKAKPTEPIQSLDKLRNTLDRLKGAVSDINNETPLITEREKGIKVSVVINAFNEEAEIGRLLASLKDAWFPGMEVIISDDGSTDRTANIVRSFQDTIESDWLTLDSHTNMGFAGAKNAGASHAKGEYLVFFDADAAIPKGLIEYDLAQMEARGIDVASHYLSPEKTEGEKVPKRLKNWLTLTLANRGMKSSKTPVVAGCGGIILRRELFDRIGGFDDVSVAEDLRLARQASEIGARVAMIEGRKMPVNMRRFDRKGHINTLLKWRKAAKFTEKGEVFTETQLEYEPIRKKSDDAKS